MTTWGSICSWARSCPTLVPPVTTRTRAPERCIEPVELAPELARPVRESGRRAGPRVLRLRTCDPSSMARPRPRLPRSALEGDRGATVLPEPVWEEIRRSRPVSSGFKIACWMAVKLSNPALRKAVPRPAGACSRLSNSDMERVP